MKTLFALITITFLCLGLANAAQPDTTKLTAKEVYKDAKSVSGTIYNDAKTAISQLATALKTTSAHVYDVLVLQQKVNSWTHIISYFLTSILNILAWRFAFNVFQKNTRDNGPIFILSSFVSVGAACYFYFTIQSTVTGFINPEYGAITQIMEMIGHL